MGPSCTTIRLFWIIVCPLGLTGCVSYEPGKNSERAVEPNLVDAAVLVGDGLAEVRFLPMPQKDVAMPFLGIDPARIRLLPALLRIDNRSGEPIKVDLGNLHLKTASGEVWATIPVSEATSRALAGDARLVDSFAVSGFPLSEFGYFVAADAYGTKSRTLEEDYHLKSFKPTLINGGACGRGVVFFEYPRAGQCVADSLLLRFSRPEGDEVIEVSMKLPATLFE